MLTPVLRIFASTASIPFLSIMRIPLVESRSLTKRFSDSTQNRWVCRLGENRRLVLLCAWETLFPETGFLPVTIQTLDMLLPRNSNIFNEF